MGGTGDCNRDTPQQADAYVFNRWHLIYCVRSVMGNQANDGHSAIKSFDVDASQGLPVAFYAEMRGHKQDQAVKCELSRDRLRLIFLSSYDKKGNPAPPSKPAGEDGLVDMVIEPSAPSQQQVRFSRRDLGRD